MLRTLKCECCGTVFTTNSGRKKYCGDRCRVKMSNQFKKGQPRRRRPQVKEKKVPHAELIETDRRAKAAGMTYGQYVAERWKQEHALKQIGE